MLSKVIVSWNQMKNNYITLKFLMKPFQEIIKILLLIILMLIIIEKKKTNNQLISAFPISNQILNKNYNKIL